VFVRWEQKADVDHQLNDAKRSLVLVTVDCLRADHCGFYGYSRSTTPFLDSLAAESFVVPTAIVGGAPTYYSLPTIFASRMPMALGRDVLGIAPGENTLATALRDSGYKTTAFSASNPYISPRFGYDQGFDTFQDFADFDAKAANVERRAATMGGTARGLANRSIRGLASALGLAPLYNDLYFEYCMKIASTVTDMDALRRYFSVAASDGPACSLLSAERSFS
jgi:arylsulfatase